MQNVPYQLKEANLNLKALFLPDSDKYDFYDLDIANAEMRVLCAYSRDEALINAFNTGKDLHCLTAAGISGIDYGQIYANKEDKTTEEYRVRQIAKKVNFGTIFCMGAESLAKQLWAEMRIKVTVEEAQEYLNQFFVTYPLVSTYITNTQNMASTYGYTTTFTGRRRRFPIIKYNKSMRGRVSRQAVNARIQSTSSDLVQSNIIELHKAIRPLGGRIILTVHDSIGFQVPKGTRGMATLLDQVVRQTTAKRFPWMPVEWIFDVAKGPSYGMCKEEVLD